VFGTTTTYTTTYGTSKATGTSRTTTYNTSRSTTYNTSRSTTFNTSKSTTFNTTYTTIYNTSTTTVFNTTYATIYNTSNVVTRRRSPRYNKAAFACGDTCATTVYRVPGSGNSSSALVQAGDNLYTNSGATIALTSGAYGMSHTTGANNACFVAVVTGSSGYVNSVYDCQCGGGDGDNGLPPI
tara:strand:- start:1598 stop:2146 length:549 start_codon:yes stop_codon:yes gene_type:complete